MVKSLLLLYGPEIVGIIGLAEKISSWVEGILLPSLNEIKGELRAISAGIDMLNSKIEERTKALDVKVEERSRSIEVEIKSLRGEVRGLAEKVDVVRDIERLKIEVEALRKKYSI